MTYLVDTNILSEATKHDADESVVRWLRFNRTKLVINPIVLGEIRSGILTLPRGKKQERLLEWYSNTVERIAVVAFDVYSGIVWSDLNAELYRKGHAMPIKDSLIAASARQHDLTVATRNVADFRYAGVRLVNPFAEG